MPRKVEPRRIVSSRKATTSLPFLTCAAHSASAIVKALRVDEVDGEQHAEEQHLGRQEHPHAQGRGLVLLVEALEVVLQRPVMGMPGSGRGGGGARGRRGRDARQRGPPWGPGPAAGRG